ncbi:MAG: RNA-binding protein [Ahrensia sp.]
MTKGPKGEKRPDDLVGMSVMVAQIATGEIQDNKKLGRAQSGQAGAKVRAQNLTPEKRSEIARRAANAGWQ